MVIFGYDTNLYSDYTVLKGVHTIVSLLCVASNSSHTLVILQMPIIEVDVFGLLLCNYFSVFI